MHPNADLYGRHASPHSHGFSGTMPWRIDGRDTTIHLSSLVRAFDTRDAAKHAATSDHPAGVYFERLGLIKRIEHPTPTSKYPYSAATQYLRHGEIRASDYRARRAWRAERRERATRDSLRALVDN